MFFGQRPSEELYDLRTDPHQVNNLATSIDHKSILIEHRNVLNKWIQQTDDKGQYSETEEEYKSQLKMWGKKCINPEYERFKE